MQLDISVAVLAAAAATVGECGARSEGGRFVEIWFGHCLDVLSLYARMGKDKRSARIGLIDKEERLIKRKRGGEGNCVEMRQRVLA